LATAPVIPEIEYLRTAYEPDCDFVDGLLEERNGGEELHSYLQSVLARLLGNRESEWGVRVYTEWRTHVAPHRYRIPDVTVIPRAAPKGGVLETPPLLCVEIWSPDDRLPRVLTRFKDYLDMGVENIWLLEPETRKGYHVSRLGMLEPQDGVLRVRNSPVHLALSELWAEFDAE
jgi:Uma2 family endonuclease